jgi:hypothetical protein
MKEVMSLLEISSILDSFNIEDIENIIKLQINNNYENDNTSDSMNNNLKPLYITYNNLLKTNLEEDAREITSIKFYNLCNKFLEAIYNKFNISIDKDWISDNIDNFPALTFSLYNFFVLNLYSNLLEFFINYIIKNIKMISELFISNLTLKKKEIVNLNDIDIITLNIPEITVWILDNINEDDYFDYLNTDELSIQITKYLFKNGFLSGDFIYVINQIFDYNLPLKSSLCFNIISRLKENKINL